MANFNSEYLCYLPLVELLEEKEILKYEEWEKKIKEKIKESEKCVKYSLAEITRIDEGGIDEGEK